MGNPSFAVPSLKNLLNKPVVDIVSVVSNPDKPKGRGKQLMATPVAQLALENQISLLQPEFLLSPEFIEPLECLNPDLFVVVAFRILPKTLLKIPKIGAINLHASLLPKYRGAAPIQWALMNNEFETGLTSFLIKPKVDTGDILLSKNVTVFPDDDYGSLSHRMSLMGAQMLWETIDLIQNESFQEIPQNAKNVTVAPKLTSEIRKINWNKSALEIHNLVKGLSPIPSAFSYLKGVRWQVFKTLPSIKSGGKSGEIIEIQKNFLQVACGTGSVKLLEVKLENKRRIKVSELLRGNPVNAGEVFDSDEK
tara:strand:+ start:1009 stop:1932 length:924 start_codon:yes stop_codon:yes gene_type:complete